MWLFEFVITLSRSIEAIFLTYVASPQFYAKLCIAVVFFCSTYSTIVLTCQKNDEKQISDQFWRLRLLPCRFSSFLLPKFDYS